MLFTYGVSNVWVYGNHLFLVRIQLDLTLQTEMVPWVCRICLLVYPCIYEDRINIGAVKVVLL